MVWPEMVCIGAGGSVVPSISGLMQNQSADTTTGLSLPYLVLALALREICILEEEREGYESTPGP